jgi:hypothetical protein
VLARVAGERATFRPDGRRVATWGDDAASVLLWEVPGPELTDGRASPTQLDRWLADLAAADPLRGWRAVQRLAAVPDQSVPALAARYETLPKADAVAGLIDRLGADRFADRQRAERELSALGSLAEAALTRAAKEAAAESRVRIERLLAALRPGGPARSREERTLALLERIATPEARVLLRRLADTDPESHLSHQSRAALGRLEARAER